MNGAIPFSSTKNKTMDQENNGLGDIVEKIIKTTLPHTAEKLKECTGCMKRKKWLNNVGAIFSNNKHETI